MPEPSDSTPSFARLEQALDAWLDYVDQGRDADAETFLAGLDPDLRPLVEPMLEVRPAPPPHPRMPAAIGSFRIVRELGRGGMGVVYEAEDQALERRVALKVLGSHFAASPASLERFRREAAAAARLRHPGIVEVFGIGETDGVHWIAMELVAGASLAERLRSGSPLGVLPDANRTAELAEIGAQVGEALDFAHQQHVVHRDIKPHNILIGEDRRVRIVDFGLAKLLDRESLSVTGEFAGSLGYASPEQLSGTRDLDARTDIWSLGIVLYEGLHGRRPFESDSHESLMRGILTREPVVTAGPRDLQVICLKALQKEPELRFATAGQMAADLRRFLEHEPIHAVLPGTVSRIMRYVRRRRPAVIAAAAIILLGILAFHFWSAQREQAGVSTRLAESAWKSLEQLESAIQDSSTNGAPGEVERHRRQVEGLVREAERLLAVYPDEPALTKIVARAHDQAGRLYQLLKLDAPALAGHGRAIELFAGLLERAPGDHDARRSLAGSFHNRHVLHRAMGRDDAADQDLDRAIRDLQQVIADDPGGASGAYASKDLAAALTNRARRALHRPAAAADLDRAVELWDAATAAQGLGAKELELAMDTRVTRANHWIRAGRLAEARTALDRAIDQLSSLVERSPRSGLRQVLAEALVRRADVARMRNDDATARADLDRAVALRLRLAGDGAADRVIQLGNAQVALAALLVEKGVDLPRAGLLLADSRRRFQALLERSPGLIAVRHQLARVASLDASYRIETKAPAPTTEAALRHAVQAHESLHADHPSDPLLADVAETRGVLGAWLRRQGRTDEAGELLRTALDTTARLLTGSRSHPVLTRNLLYQGRELLSLTDRPGHHAELVAIAERIMAALPTHPNALRISVRACDRGIHRHPGPAAERNRFAEAQVAQAQRWIRRADAAGVDWRTPGYARSLPFLNRHPKLGPLLTAAQEQDR